MSNQKKQVKKEIKIADNIPGAEYANAMQVNHTKDEFQMMFLNIFGASGRVTNKIISSPGHVKKMVLALTENIKKYEDNHGKIEEAEIGGNEIGFKENK
ncbi:DUF3467 domain-containing protein [Candidatus Parcubacteria bacterium]|nr:MAG: DUF3467 domain-containing protein [Candidatus Parcubacteria bacterium]